jgi:c-di-GMP-binding flagellar brake protein YcgR
VIILCILALRKTIQHGREVLGRTEALFSENARRCKLTEPEIEFIKALTLGHNLGQPHVIFQSLTLFEQCVDAYIRRFLESRPAPNELEESDRLFVELRGKLGFDHLALEHPLASSRNISTGQGGSLFSKDGGRALFRKVTVVGNSPFYLTLRYNVEKEEVRHLLGGQIVRFAFARQSDGLYGFQSLVAKADGAGTIDLLHTTELKRNQLRQYVRIETSLPLRFRLIQTPDPDKSDIKRDESCTAKMCDVSGGGLSFIYEKSLRLGDVISLSFDLPGAACAGVMGKIVHLTLREGKDGPLFKNHVQFVNIETRKREKIISYVFEKERQLSQWK